MIHRPLGPIVWQQHEPRHQEQRLPGHHRVLWKGRFVASRQEINAECCRGGAALVEEEDAAGVQGPVRVAACRREAVRDGKGHRSRAQLFLQENWRRISLFAFENISGSRFFAIHTCNTQAFGAVCGWPRLELVSFDSALGGRNQPGGGGGSHGATWDIDHSPLFSNVGDAGTAADRSSKERQDAY